MMEMIQGIWDSAFALVAGMMVGILACKLGVIDWAIGLFVKR